MPRSLAATPQAASQPLRPGSPARAASSPVCGFDDLALLPDGDVIASARSRLVRIDMTAGTMYPLHGGV
jgi:hypothetical protein